MLFFIDNNTNRTVALRSAVQGEMVKVAPKSSGFYDLDIQASRLEIPGLSVVLKELDSSLDLDLENTQENTASAPVDPPPAFDPAPAVELKKHKADQKTTVPVAIKASDKNPEAEAPEAWQKGLEAPK